MIFRMICEWFHRPEWRIDLSQEWGRLCGRCGRRFAFVETLVDGDAWLQAKYGPELERLLALR